MNKYIWKICFTYFYAEGNRDLPVSIMVATRRNHLGEATGKAVSYLTTSGGQIAYPRSNIIGVELIGELAK